MLQIEGSPVVVTGGLRGIGRALVDELLQRGAANVYATARAPKPSGDPRVLTTALDVADTDSVAALSETATDVTIVINNAGTVGASSLVSSDLEEIRAVFETNYFAALRIARAFAPILVRNGGGARVDIHSVLSWVAGSGAYGDSKAALWLATNPPRIELERQKTLVGGPSGLQTQPKNDPKR